eukprot:GHVP01006677.1.p1 GENE.GHVP01006677.1~~GHVP01006677.1.p1  ORF type:complete len:422 (+),score=62.05 GHVP01006677.1:129-1268(+)
MSSSCICLDYMKKKAIFYRLQLSEAHAMASGARSNLKVKLKEFTDQFEKELKDFKVILYFKGLFVPEESTLAEMKIQDLLGTSGIDRTEKGKLVLPIKYTPKKILEIANTNLLNASVVKKSGYRFFYQDGVISVIRGIQPRCFGSTASKPNVIYEFTKPESGWIAKILEEYLEDFELKFLFQGRVLSASFVGRPCKEDLGYFIEGNQNAIVYSNLSYSKRHKKLEQTPIDTSEVTCIGEPREDSKDPYIYQFVNFRNKANFSIYCFENKSSTNYYARSLDNADVYFKISSIKGRNIVSKWTSTKGCSALTSWSRHSKVRGVIFSVVCLACLSTLFWNIQEAKTSRLQDSRERHSSSTSRSRSYPRKKKTKEKRKRRSSF